MKKKKSLEQDINDFLECWDCDQMSAFLRDIIPLFELYNVDEESDWLRDAVGDEEAHNVRLIRTVYLVSRIAEFHAGRLAIIRVRFKDIFRRMEKESVVVVE